MDFRDISGI